MRITDIRADKRITDDMTFDELFEQAALRGQHYSGNGRQYNPSQTIMFGRYGRCKVIVIAQFASAFDPKMVRVEWQRKRLHATLIDGKWGTLGGLMSAPASYNTLGECIAYNAAINAQILAESR